MNYETDKSKAKTLSFVVLSSLFHVSMAAGILHLSYQVIKELPKTVEIEIIDAHQDTVAPILKPEIETAKVEQAATLPATKNEIIKPTKSLKSNLVAPEKFKAGHKSAPSIAIAKAAPPSQPTTVIEAPPALETPVIEDESFDLPLVATTPSEVVDDKQVQKDLENSLSNIEPVAVNAEPLDKDMDQALTDKDESLNKTLLAAQAEDEKEHQLRTKAINAEKDQARAMLAQEDAQMEANRIAAENAKAAAQAAALKQAQEAAAAQAAAAIAKANKVRTLEEIRQKPGNKRPLYDNEDRFNGRVGEVSFLALINKTGEPVEFKIVKSTGHKSLDLKTLKAIRNWRFYPGQEGWVEIPFKWDLQGGAQEMPATLRRKVSQN